MEVKARVLWGLVGGFGWTQAEEHVGETGPNAPEIMNYIEPIRTWVDAGL